MTPVDYPQWKCYPVNLPPPIWVNGVLESFREAAAAIDSKKNHGVKSNDALAALKPGLESKGFEIEDKTNRIARPVLFEENGAIEVEYRVDGYHPDFRVVLEVEAGRGAANNADYRDLIRTSLMVDSEYLVLAMMVEYKTSGQVIRSYEKTRKRIDAIYASDRLELGLKGILLVGY
jgi:hypothetical protein